MALLSASNILLLSPIVFINIPPSQANIDGPTTKPLNLTRSPKLFSLFSIVQFTNSPALQQAQLIAMGKMKSSIHTVCAKPDE